MNWKLLLALFLSLGESQLLFADDLQKARFTEVIRDVRVTKVDASATRNVKVNDLFEVPEVIRTGMDSRAELEAPDKTIARIGANTIFSFEASKRTMNLQSGSVLFHSPKGMGGGTIKTAAATAAVTGTTIMVGATTNGGFKLMVLEGSSKVTLPNGVSQRLNEGQLTFVLPGKQNQLPVIDFKLSAQTKGSSLVGGFNKPLASLDKIEKAEAKQEQNISKGKLQNTTLRIAGDPKEGNLPLNNDGTNFPSVSEISPSSKPSLSNYLNGRFATVNFSLLNGSGDLRPSELFFNLNGENSNFGGKLRNFGNSFAVFGANRISFSDGASLQIPSGSLLGQSIQDFGFIADGNINFLGSANFQGASNQDIHFLSLNGDITIGSGIVNAFVMNFDMNKIEFETPNIMNIAGTTFNGSNYVFTGGTINFFKGNLFGSNVKRVDFWTRNGGYTVWDGSIPIAARDNGTLNFVGSSLTVINLGTVGGTNLDLPTLIQSFPNGPINGNPNAVAHTIGGP